MKILHVSMGLPPFRTGGLNRYCLELMQSQKKQGESVSLLYPGEFSAGKKTAIREMPYPEFQLYRVVNPLPLALTNGVSAPERYMRPCANPEVYRAFLSKHRPDVIHVHSLQGIHREFFQIAGELKIRMVFTTHDYYPFCPRCVLLEQNGTLCTGPEGEKCARCNQGGGLSRMQEIVMQSRLYEQMKYSPLLKKIRAQQVKKVSGPAEPAAAVQAGGPLPSGAEYTQLTDYYQSILCLMDCIHCNSETAEKVYAEYVPGIPRRVVGITHSGLHTAPHCRDAQQLRLGFVGGINRYKGLEVLLKAAEILEKRGIGYQLFLYGGDYTEYAQKNQRIHNGGYYTRETEDAMWQTFDLLAVPSQCYETFGFVVAEALAHGVAVVCSDLVGARQLLNPQDIFVHDSAQDLADTILKSHTVPALPEELLSMQRHAQTLKQQLYRA